MKSCSSPRCGTIPHVWRCFGKTLARALAASSLPIRWIIADDGSTGDEHARLDRSSDNDFAGVFPRVELHFAAHHHGKGSVVREAWALAPDAAWLAFVDADGSVTAEEMLGLIRKADRRSESRCSASASAPRPRTIVESPWRGFAHRGFLLAAHVLLDLQCEDVQCGAKVIKGEDYRGDRPPALREWTGIRFGTPLHPQVERCGLDRDSRELD